MVFPQLKCEERPCTFLLKFKKLVLEKELIVIGAVYDFQDTYKQGLGRLIVINVNGEKDPEKITKSEYFKDNKNLVTMKKHFCNSETTND